MYKSDDKIIDVRTNTIHVVDCVDHYDSVSLVFTKNKKYIPIEFTKKYVNNSIKTEDKVLDLMSNYKFNDEEFNSLMDNLKKSFNK
jgi:hypothetical protein